MTGLNAISIVTIALNYALAISSFVIPTGRWRWLGWLPLLSGTFLLYVTVVTWGRP